MILAFLMYGCGVKLFHYLSSPIHAALGFSSFYELDLQCPPILLLL